MCAVLKNALKIDRQVNGKRSLNEIKIDEIKKLSDQFFIGL